eukprot:g29609.t1
MKALVNAIINAFLQYVFRPLDHFLFTKDRYTSRFSALSPLAAYFSAARTALNGHAWYPYPVCPAWTVGPYCSKCPGNAAFWCVECNARFCPACAARFHHPGLYTEHHSLEPIKKETLALARSEHLQDSFYKFFLDGWVRGVVTASDDTLLVLTSAGPAYIMTTVLSIFLVPVVAACYGALMGVAHAIDSHLPQSQGLADAEEWLQRFDLCSIFGGQCTAPPLTEPRLRPSLERAKTGQRRFGRRRRCERAASDDFYDKMKYNKNRRLRMSNYHAAVARDDLNYWVNRSVPWFVGLLLVWCPFDLAYLLRVLCSFLGFGKTIEEHQTWFSTPVAGMLFSDAFSVSLLRNLNAATSAILALLPFADGVSNAIIFLFLSVLAVIVGFLIFLYLITEQQREYYSKWTDESVQQKLELFGSTRSGKTVGCCARESCKCESIQFFTEKAVQE